jgi:hypothetical protein
MDSRLHAERSGRAEPKSFSPCPEIGALAVELYYPRSDSCSDYSVASLRSSATAPRDCSLRRSQFPSSGCPEQRIAVQTPAARRGSQTGSQWVRELRCFQRPSILRLRIFPTRLGLPRRGRLRMEQPRAQPPKPRLRPRGRRTGWLLPGWNKARPCGAQDHEPILDALPPARREGHSRRIPRRIRGIRSVRRKAG